MFWMQELLLLVVEIILGHWKGIPSSEDIWISSEELKKVDELLWVDLIENSRSSSY